METILNKESRAAIELMIADGIITKDTAERYFPELKESEDEKISKELINALNKFTNGHTSLLYKKEDFLKWIAWVEKQGSQDNAEDVDILHRFSFYSYKDEPNILYLSGIYVNEDCRNKGIGTKILKVTDEVAVNMKCDFIRLKTEKDSHAEKLYRENGYTIIFLEEEENQIWLEKQVEQNIAEISNVCEFSIETWIKIVDYVLTEHNGIGNYLINPEVKDTAEKLQKKYKFDVASEEWDRVYRKGLDTGVNKGRAEALREQNPAWSEEDENVIYFLINVTENYRIRNGFSSVLEQGNKAIDWLKSLKDRVQLKQEWDEEDEDIKQSIIDILTRQGFQTQVDWLKSLKDRVQPQPKQEWSEKDEKMHQSCTRGMQTYEGNDTKCSNWLKSLKERVLSQNIVYYNPYKEVVESIAEMCKHYDNAGHSGLRDFYDNIKIKCKDAKEYDSLYLQSQWKPSDEQMDALKLSTYCQDKKMSKVLFELYQDLLKLKE